MSDDVHTTLRHALELIGGTNDLGKTERSVVVKVGVFNPKNGAHSTVPVVGAIVNSFKKSPRTYLVESDNYKGKGYERLQIWKELFSNSVMPFDLSQDAETVEVKVADERIRLSHILFKPNVFISTHVLRQFDKGSVLKNLLGLIPDAKKMRFHKRLEETLLDLYEAIGGIDLAVLDGTFMYPSTALAKGQRRISTDVLVVGRDTVAVEAVGAAIVGMDPNSMPVIKEAEKRGLGEGNIEKIEVLGSSIQSQREKICQLLKIGRKSGRFTRIN